MLDEIKKIKSGRNELRNFGLTIGLILFIIAGVLFFKEKDIYVTLSYFAGGFISFGVIYPRILKPIYFVWMIFAAILGWVMTRVILILIFYLIITPIGLITRILGEDFLALKKLKVDSHWNYRNSSKELSQDYEKQF